ncbi:MAG: serine hydrolase [Bacteroidales bacterium]|nr:serine hydrolase [Bacteroidales bacterium]
MKKSGFYSLIVLISISVNLNSQYIKVTDIDSVILTADRLIETNPRVFFKNVESFIVWYDGKIRFEKYYNGAEEDSLHQIQSQTKSIVSLLLGIAIDKGFIADENESVNRYFPEYFNPGESLRSNLKIKDLLTMSAGFDWEEMLPLNDPGNDNIKMFNSGNYLQYALSKPVVKPPLTEFEYNSGCPMIIAGIIERSSKMSLSEFADKYLFKPLGINDYYWIKDSKGFCHAGGGLFLKPNDIVKIGIMVLNKGRWENKKIISENWILKSTQSYLSSGFDISGYGYFWWIRYMPVGEGLTTKVITAEGAGGQKLYIFSDYRLVIAFTERNFTTPQVSPLFIQESVLPILR